MPQQGRNIFGYFQDRHEAEHALNLLKQAGFGQSHLDTINRSDEGIVPADGDPHTLSGAFGSLSRLTMGGHTGTDAGDDDSGIMMSASTSASGYAADETHPTGFGWLIVSMTDGSDVEVERAVKIMKSYGGHVAPGNK